LNLYSEAIFQEALEERNVGVKVNGVCVNNIRYADDTVLIADNMDDLRDMLAHMLTNTDFDLGLRIRFVKCYAWTVLLYGMEGWTLKVSTMNKLEAFCVCTEDSMDCKKNQR